MRDWRPGPWLAVTLCAFAVAFGIVAGGWPGLIGVLGVIGGALSTLWFANQEKRRL